MALDIFLHGNVLKREKMRDDCTNNTRSLLQASYAPCRNTRNSVGSILMANKLHWSLQEGWHLPGLFLMSKNYI